MLRRRVSHTSRLCVRNTLSARFDAELTCALIRLNGVFECDDALSQVSFRGSAILVSAPRDNTVYAILNKAYCLRVLEIHKKGRKEGQKRLSESSPTNA